MCTCVSAGRQYVCECVCMCARTRARVYKTWIFNGCVVAVRGTPGVAEFCASAIVCHRARGRQIRQRVAAQRRRLSAQTCNH